MKGNITITAEKGNRGTTLSSKVDLSDVSPVDKLMVLHTIVTSLNFNKIDRIAASVSIERDIWPWSEPKEHPVETGVVMEQMSVAPAFFKAMEKAMATKNEKSGALTYDQLLEMDGEMVRIPESDNWFGGTGVVSVEGNCVKDPDGDDPHSFWPFECYGDWLAYSMEEEEK